MCVCVSVCWDVEGCASVDPALNLKYQDQNTVEDMIARPAQFWAEIQGLREEGSNLGVGIAG